MIAREGFASLQSYSLAFWSLTCTLISPAARPVMGAMVLWREDAEATVADAGRAAPLFVL